MKISDKYMNIGDKYMNIGETYMNIGEKIYEHVCIFINIYA